MIRSAAEEFVRRGYVDATLQDILDGVGITKGGLYCHFQSKQQLARAVIDAGFTRLDQLCAQRMNTQTSAAEALIEFTYALTDDPPHGDPMIAAAFRLVLEIGDYRGTAPAPVFDGWITTCRDLVRRAGTEGDLHEDIDPDVLAQFLIEATYGVRLHTAAPGLETTTARQLTAMWRMLLPGLTDPVTGRYLSQFAARRSPPANTRSASPPAVSPAGLNLSPGARPTRTHRHREERGPAIP